ncbi:MAG: peptidoglycan-binding protein [Acidimicrobiia bacterium]|nr:peptidoglycan-binding protein [Acidimicrobiia bacterium]
MTDTGKHSEDIRVDTPTASRPSIRRHLKWIIPLVVVAAAATVWVLLPSGDEEAEDASAAAALEFEAVTVTDLTEVTSFNGTLGFDEGDPIAAGRSGTITAASAEGTEVHEGEILFVVDDQPEPLLYGDTTVWRAMGDLPQLEPFTPRMAGTVTWLAEEDTSVEQGDVLMEIDEEPVVVLFGELPAYRMLRRTNEGDDVRQLQDALVALGYDPDGNMELGTFDWWTQEYVEEWQADIGAPEDGRVDLGEVVFVAGPFTIDEWTTEVGSQAGGGSVANTYSATEATEGDDVLALEAALERLGFTADGAMTVDGVFDAGTTAAVTAWQASIGAEDDGVVSPGEIVFLPGAVRISDRLAEPGASVSPGTPVLATSSDESVVTVDLPAADQAILAVGDRVVIVLPDDTEVDGAVSFKAETATIGQQGEATFEVAIVLDDVTAAAGLDQAPVDVEVITGRADGVMAIPVTALLALAEGGYAVEVEQADGTTRLVAVDPGMYADGLVEVASDVLKPGDRVVAP